MRLLDRNIALRFLANFVTLFCLLFVFAVSIDVVLQFDSFVSAARSAVEDGRFSSVAVATVAAIFDFHGPRVFQFCAVMIGLVCVGAAGFTLGQMQRSRELVAMLASGIPLQRVAMAIFVAAAVLNGLQILNQELIIPRLAGVLLREHGEILSSSRSSFEVPLTRDVHDNLLSAALLDPVSITARDILILERDEEGTAARRIFAPSAQWSEESGSWLLTDGTAIERNNLDEGVIERSIAVDSYATDLSPRALSVRRHRDHAQMLSTSQIIDLRAEESDAARSLGRLVWARIGAIGVNLLVLLLVIPSFLRRRPGPLLSQSIQCAAIGVPALMFAALVMMLPVSGVSPAIMALLPTALLIPLAFWRMASMKT
jgi:lipopolysaccharide export LptBFGC system permease protein LptF